MYHTKEYFVTLLGGYQGIELQNLKQAAEELNIVTGNDDARHELMKLAKAIESKLDDLKDQIDEL